MTAAQATIGPQYNLAIANAIANAIAGLFRAEAPVSAVKAKVNFTLATLPLEGEALTIGEESYVFTATPTLDNHIQIGIDAAATKATLLSVITDESAGYTVALGDGGIVVFSSKTAGASGNAIAVSDTLTAEGDGFDAASLSGGVDGTVANANQFFIDETALWIAYKPCTVSESFFKQIVTF
ncbi:hypothetical protein SDC9_156063 [bioreactor metagenome]|uniref:Uncharacterized protein n=1 Tax=bioreactor metagenome TaxID=1076179 RepID=A0A645F374_9ZZZZ